MAFTVYTSEDATPAGSEFGDNDRFSISSGVLIVDTAAGQTRVYAPGFWQLVEYGKHPIGNISFS